MSVFNEIAIAQINTHVGNINKNCELIILSAQKAALLGAKLVVFPELTISGYPPEDLALTPDFVAAQTQALNVLVAKSLGLPAMIVGFIERVEDRNFNSLAFIEAGEIKHIHRKTILPNYGVFDERRVFAVGQAPKAFVWNERKIGLLLCEDAWQPHSARLLKAQGAELIIVVNASPYEGNKQKERIKIISQTAHNNSLGVIYANLVGGQDDLVFDGNSFACDEKGELICSFPAFEEKIELVTKTFAKEYSREEEIWQAITLATRDYFYKSGFKKAVLGLSGGIDSAVVAAILVDALGAENILGILLPSEFTSLASKTLAETLADSLAIKTQEVPISPVFEAVEAMLIPTLAEAGVNTKNWRENLNIGGNIQSRLRGLHLMAISNATGALVVNTSNKSEIAVGYSTIYGDSCGAFAPIRDIYKTDVYALAKWRGISKEIIKRVPTAELAPNQKDEDQLPSYTMLDSILKLHIEEKLGSKEIIAQGFIESVVHKVLKLVKTSEYKRRQFPPGPKISRMHFYKDWRMPITNGFQND